MGTMRNIKKTITASSITITLFRNKLCKHLITVSKIPFSLWIQVRVSYVRSRRFEQQEESSRGHYSLKGVAETPEHTWEGARLSQWALQGSSFVYCWLVRQSVSETENCSSSFQRNQASNALFTHGICSVFWFLDWTLTVYDFIFKIFNKYIFLKILISFLNMIINVLYHQTI